MSDAAIIAAQSRTDFCPPLQRGQFVENSLPTVGAAFLTQTLHVEGKTLKLEIWYIFASLPSSPPSSSPCSTLQTLVLPRGACDRGILACFKCEVHMLSSPHVGAEALTSKVMQGHGRPGEVCGAGAIVLPRRPRSTAGVRHHGGVVV